MADPVKIVVTLALFVGGWQLAMHRKGPPPAELSAEAPRETGRLHVVEDERYRFVHRVSPRRQTLRVTAAATQQHRGTPEAGVQLTLHYLDRKGTAAFLKKHAGSDRCPAPFFNRHAQQKMLLTENKAIQTQLKKWRQREYANVRHWRTAEITGRCLTENVEAKRDGEDVLLPRNFYDDCLSFLVEEFSIAPFETEAN